MSHAHGSERSAQEMFEAKMLAYKASRQQETDVNFECAK